MSGIIRLSFLIVACSAVLVNSKTTVNPKAMNPALLVAYLNKYGYLKPLDPRTGSLRTAEELKMAVQTLQVFGGLEPTGDLNDPELLELTSKSRCGVPDVGPSDSTKRRRRYVIQGTKWRKTGLTYRIVNYTPDLSREQVDTTIRDAFALWASISSLTFKKVTDPRIKVDILIRFIHGSHGDGYPFDGPGGVLAHAFYPHGNEGLAGDAHFDEAETFTLKTDSGIDLFWVAVHEFGHSLGLDHSNHPSAVMYPFYRGYIKDFRLHDDDIRGMQFMYGKKGSKATPPVERVTPTPHYKTEAPGIPNKCSATTSMDAFVMSDEGYTYAFKEAYFWPIHDTGAWTDALKIADYWPQLEDNIDAGFFRRSDNMTFILKGNKFWMFKGRNSFKGKADITDPELRLPAELANIDAALQWGYNDKVYFFKGDKYWRYNTVSKSIDYGYPRTIQEGWNRAVPDNIDAAVQWKNKRSYFFKGGDYWAIDESTLPVKVLKADIEYPRKISTYWMGCSPEGLVGGKISPVGNSAYGVLPNVAMFLISFVLTKLM